MSQLHLKTADGLNLTVLNGQRDSVDAVSPAIEVMTDFSKQTPAVVGADTDAEEAIRWLHMEKFPWQLVVSADQSLRGILVKGAEAEQNLMRRVANGEERSILAARDIMLPLRSLHCLTIAEVETATVSELLTSLKQSGAEYCLVLDNEYEQLRGLISAHEVIERLGLELSIRRNPTFVDIFNAVHP